jgi:hypothetical protein
VTDRTHYESFYAGVLPKVPEQEARFQKILEEAHAKDPASV